MECFLGIPKAPSGSPAGAGVCVSAWNWSGGCRREHCGLALPLAGFTLVQILGIAFLT